MTLLVSTQEEQVSLDALNYLRIYFPPSPPHQGFKYKSKQASLMLAAWPRTCTHFCICRGIALKCVPLHFQCNVEVFFYFKISRYICFLLLYVIINKKSVVSKCISHLFSFASHFIVVHFKVIKQWSNILIIGVDISCY